MAVVEPYAPCPCGSGQKFKWCCQKVEAFADRAERLFQHGQVDAALAALDEGLRKQADNAWLLVRKASYLSAEGKGEAALPILRRVVEVHPDHSGAQSLLIRLLLESEGVRAGIDQFQIALQAIAPDRRGALGVMAQLIAVLLGDNGYFPAALKHLDLSDAIGSTTEELANLAETTRRNIEGNAAISPWLKIAYDLEPAPDDLGGEARAAFDRALALAGDGLWAPAAAIFDSPAVAGSGTVAVSNLAFCRLWLADFAGAAEAFRRSIPGTGESDEEVDREALAQLLATPGKDDLVEQIQWIWPVRNREALLKALREEPDVVEGGVDLFDPNVEDSPEAETFDLLDRPALDRVEGLKIDEVPRVLGRVLVGPEAVALEAYDDDRLGGLGDRFTALAGSSIAPAHPRTKVLGEEQRSTLTFHWSWSLPEGLDPIERIRLETERQERALLDDWTATPLHYLGGRTAVQAATSGGFHRALRAAVLRMEVLGSLGGGDESFAKLRRDLDLEPEPEIDPTGLDLDRIHPGRLHLIALDRLDDRRLIELYILARAFKLHLAAERAALGLIERPSAFQDGLPPFTVFSELATLAASRGRRDAAFDWIARGRQADSPADRRRNAPTWDMFEVQTRVRLEPPESWVPELAVVMDRYKGVSEANQAILMGLVAMGLVQPIAHPDRPEEVMLDPRPLQGVLELYGPKVTTASGRLGVSATKGEIWTPGGPSAPGGGLWTPGSPASPPEGQGGDKPRLILPGR